MKKPSEFLALLKSIKSEWKWILRHSAQYKGIIALYIIIGIGGVGFSLAGSVLSKNLIDSVISHDSDSIWIKAIAVLIFVLLQIAVTSVTSWISVSTGTKVHNELRKECYSDILCAKWGNIGKYHSGDLINRLEGDINSVSSVVIGFIPGLITKSVQVIASFFVLLHYDTIMALLSLLSAPVLFISSRVMVKTIRKFNQRSREINGQILSFSEESVQNLQIIKAFNLQKRYIADFCDLLNTFRTIKMKYEKFSILMTLVFSATGLIVTYLCYGWAVYRLWGNLITVGTLTLFIQISGYLSSSFSSFAGMLPSTITIATAAGRLMEISDIEKELNPDDEKVRLFVEESADDKIILNVNDISFSYDNDRDVLRKISLECSSGDFVAVTGSSGIGKTTFLRLLLGLIEPCEGTISVTNSKKSTVSVNEQSRDLFSYVPQESCIFSGTIAENLLLGNENATIQDMINVLNCVDLLKHVESLPDGLNTKIGERGSNFSVGQCQRISVARSLLKPSKIILFDEATSALDENTEESVLSNIRKYYSDRIIIFTTHKKKISLTADKILNID